MAESYSNTRETHSDDGAGAERALGWLFAGIALALGAIGLLRGFGIIGTEGVDIPGTDALPGEGVLPGLEAGVLQSAAIAGDFWDGMVWLVPTLAAGVLAWCMSGARGYMTGDREGMRIVAYLTAAVTVALGALAILVGFDMFGQGHTQTDGILWGVAAVATSLVTGASFAAVPSRVAEEDYLVSVVERRVSRPGYGTTGTTQYGTRAID